LSGALHLDYRQLLADLRQDPALAAQIQHVAQFPAREARFAAPEEPMHAKLRERLEALGVAQLYSHQAAAYDAAMRGDDVVVVTGTNSGKTMCYNLPALQMSLCEPACRALYLFPTKALAQDQLGKLNELAKGLEVRAGTYDGDTPPNQRSPLRRIGHIILTNPDMLHIGILPGHENWSRFLKSLRLIVIDEMHVYRGVFGSHVGNILRRLLRLCEWHRNRPQIIACSATIGNPQDLFGKLTGRRGTLVAEDGSPQGRRTFVFWNPPKVNEAERASANVVVSEVLATLAEAQLRTLTFCRARISTELVLRYVRRRLKDEGEVPPEKVESYRAGYTVKERRQIEKAIFKGDLLGLVATNAMELGVDIGGLDAVLMNGYPGTISSFWQQAGRAGRGDREGMAIMVAHDDPLEQFLVREPHMVLEGLNETVSANPENPQILAQQIRCAAHERPIAPSELEAFGPTALELAETLDRSGELQFSAGRFFYPSHEPPAPKVNIRGSGGDEVRLMLDGQELGTMERWRATQNAHKGAVYLHRGSSFVVLDLDLEAGQAHLEPREVEYYTQPITQSVIETLVELDAQPLSGFEAKLAGVRVTDMVAGYRVKSLDGDTVLGVYDLDLPPQTFETMAVRLTVEAGGLEALIGLPMCDSEDPEAPPVYVCALHGVEHALLAVAPLIAGCDRGDLGSAWYAAHPDTFKPTLYIFDRTPGGVGLAEKLMDNLMAWRSAALQLLLSCPCEEGCPACLLSPRCEVSNDALDKSGAIRLLKALRSMPEDQEG
jgi:DEAD/DEAH box helicase domain-containing protein